MKVHIEDIGEDGLNLDIIKDAAECSDTFRDGVISISPVNAHLAIARSDSDIFVNGSIYADIKINCVRCLAQFDNHIHSDINLVFLKAVEEKLKEGEKELSKEDLDVNYYTGDELDITAILREQIVLDLPVKPLCKPDCTGLCPKCGADLNKWKCSCSEEKHIDTRLKKLKEFILGKKVKRQKDEKELRGKKMKR